MKIAHLCNEGLKYCTFWSTICTSWRTNLITQKSNVQTACKQNPIVYVYVLAPLALCRSIKTNKSSNVHDFPFSITVNSINLSEDAQISQKIHENKLIY